MWLRKAICQTNNQQSSFNACSTFHREMSLCTSTGWSECGALLQSSPPPFCEQFIPLVKGGFWHDMIAVHCLQGRQCFLPWFPPLNEKFHRDSLFESIRTRHCVHFRLTALHTNIRYMTTIAQITTKIGTVVPDPPRYNICLFLAYQCGLASQQKWFWLLNCQASYLWNYSIICTYFCQLFHNFSKFL